MLPVEDWQASSGLPSLFVIGSPFLSKHTPVLLPSERLSCQLKRISPLWIALNISPKASDAPPTTSLKKLPKKVTDLFPETPIVFAVE